MREAKLHRYRYYHPDTGEEVAWCGIRTLDDNISYQITWEGTTCNKCLQNGYKIALRECVDILKQANLISCNLTTFHTLRDLGELAMLAQRNRNRFIAENEEEQDG